MNRVLAAVDLNEVVDAAFERALAMARSSEYRRHAAGLRRGNGPHAQARALWAKALMTSGERGVVVVNAILKSIANIDQPVAAREPQQHRLALERALDNVLADSFPASDPPSWTPGVTRPAPAPAPADFLTWQTWS